MVFYIFCFALLTLNCSTGDKGYQQAGSNKRWQLVQELREAQAAVTLLDQHLDRQLASLPKKIIDAVNSIMQARQDSNHEFAYVASGIALGRIIRNAGLLINTATITTATALNVIGLSISAGAFGASRAVNVVNPNLGCGIVDYNSVLEQYEVLTVLRETYSGIGRQQTYQSQAGPPAGYPQPLPGYQSRSYQDHSGLSLPASLQPQVLAYTAQDFGSELKSRLGCLLDGKTALERCIDNTVEAMEKRLTATQELINISQKLEIVDKNSQSQSQYG